MVPEYLGSMGGSGNYLNWIPQFAVGCLRFYFDLVSGLLRDFRMTLYLVYPTHLIQTLIQQQ